MLVRLYLSKKNSRYTKIKLEYAARHDLSKKKLDVC